jgi:replicative DNA helicase
MTDLQKDQVLPYNLLAERLVLGSILINPEAIRIVSQHLTIETFYLTEHQLLYKSALLLYGQGKSVDYINLTTYLQDQGLTSHLKDLAIIADFINQVVSIGHLEDYIALIYEKFLRRSLIELGNEIVNSAYLTQFPIENLFLNIEKKLFFLAEKQKIQNFSSTAEILNQILTEIKNRLKATEIPGLISAFYDLDAITQGFQNSELIIVAGRPSMGKTAFSLNLAKNITEKFQKVLVFFSLEMTRKQLIYRLLSTETLIPTTRLRSGRISKNEWISLNQAVLKLSKLNIYIDDSSHISVSKIHLKIKKLQNDLKKNLGLVIIDYLQLLEGIGKIDNRVQEVSKITRDLKKLARDFNIPVIVLSQLSRNVETRLNKRPILSDLRESGCFNISKNYLKYWEYFKKKSFQSIDCNSLLSWTGKEFFQEIKISTTLTGKKPTYIIQTVLGWCICTTSNHKLLTLDGWKRIDQLHINDFISLKLIFSSELIKTKAESNLSWDKIKSIQFFEISLVYDIRVFHFSNYLTNRIVVHNSIEQDADLVILLYRDDYYNANTVDQNIIELIVAKHRNGPVGSAKLYFDPKFLRFSNL